MSRAFPHPNYAHGFVCPICRTAADAPVVLVPNSEPDEDGICTADQVHEDCFNLVRRMSDIAASRA